MTSRLPVLICPYLHDGEDAEIREAFGLGRPETSHIEFDLWQDVDSVGPERAFQFLWDRHPGRDVVIVHSDMRPMPGEPPAAWFDDLVDHARRQPAAGMLACTLYYPCRGDEAPASVVQCAGGTFDDGVLSHITGVVGQPTDEGGVDPDLLAQVRPVPWVTFGGVYIRREVLDACGPVDSRYQWAYVADVDYSFEARSRGFELLQVPVGLQHEESRTTGPLLEARPELAAHIEDNTARFHDKWRGRLEALPPVTAGPVGSGRGAQRFSTTSG